MELATVIVESVKGLTGIGAVTVAFLGLRTWRRQLYGTAEYERARRLYRSVLEVRDQLASVRAPFISVGEMHEAFKDDGIEPDKGDVTSDKRTNGLVYQRRWKGVVSAMSNLRVELLEAEVLWGEAVREPETQLRRCLGELYAAVVMHAQNRESSGHENPRNSEFWEKQFAILYDQSGAEPDDFARRVNEAVAGFERLLRPHLNGRLSRPAT
jgi:hypothetical protein